jgi:hypothetical protein
MVFGYINRVVITVIHPRLLTAISSALLVLIFSVTGFAQNSGKAEPRKIELQRGRSSILLSGSLSNSEEMEYAFTARKGQSVTISNPNTSLFDVRIFSDEAEVETEFDSSRSFSVDIPADGDYLVYVRKKLVQRPRRARFAITLSIR